MDDIEIISLLRAHRRLIVYLTIALGSIVAFGAGWKYLRQPRTTVISLVFRPAFSSAAEGKYPNDTPFSPTDITARSVLDAVYDASGSLKTHCSRDAFAHGFFVDQDSVEIDSLDAEYASQLSSRELNAADRQRLLDEYRLKRSAQQMSFRLGFIVPAECSAVSSSELRKALGDVLVAWANESQDRRGVLNLPAAIMTPDMMDSGGGGNVARLVRVDQIRVVIEQALATVTALRAFPGADLVRLPDGKTTTLVDLQTRLAELQRTRLEPLIVEAGPSLGADSVRWAESALASAEAAEQTAQSRAQSYATALREFGASQFTPSARNDAPRGSGAESGMTTQIDRGFVDRMIELSKENTLYRQQLAASMVKESLKAVQAENEVSYHRRMLASLKSGRSSMNSEAVDREVASIVSAGKELLQQMGRLYREISIVALRPASGLYRVDAPVRQTVEQGFALRTAEMIALAGFFGAFILSIASVILFALARARFPQLR